MTVHLTFDTAPAVLLENDGPPRMSGTAVPFGAVSAPSISDGRRYRFSGGPDNEMVGTVAVREHDDYTPIGTIGSADLTDDGIDVAVDLIDTSAGRDSHAELKAKVRNGLSVSFDPIEAEESEDGVVDVRRWKINHLGHVRHAAFGDLTTAVAASTKEGEMPETTATEETAGTARLAERMDQLEARMSAPQPEHVTYLSVRESLTAQMEGSRNKPRLLALADVISSGNAGVLPPAWSSEVRSSLDATRYLIPRLGSIGFPATGTGLTVPKILTHTSVSARGTEKTQVPSAALTTGSDTFPIAWFAGAVDVGMETISQSDPAIVALVVENLLNQYAAVTDLAAYTSLNAAATATGAALSFASYGAFVATIMDTAEAIRQATGYPGDLVQLKTASWKSLMSLVDSQGRRILASVNPTNADGSAQLTSASVDVGGITVFHNARATQDIQFNAYSARIGEKPPQQMQAVNVDRAGYDIGILGATMFAPMYPTGIKRHAATELREGESKRK